MDMIYADAIFVCASGESGAISSAVFHSAIAPARSSGKHRRTLLVLDNAEIVVC